MMKASPGDVEIICGVTQSDTVDELSAECGSTVRQLRLQRQGGVLVLHIDRVFVSLISHSASVEVDLAFLRIRERLHQRRSWASRVLSSQGVLVTMRLAAAASAVFSWGSFVGALPSTLVAILSLVLMIARANVLRGMGSRVNLIRRHQASVFWSRNRDKLILTALGGLGGFILCFLGEWLVTQLTLGGTAKP